MRLLPHCYIDAFILVSVFAIGFEAVMYASA